MKRETADNFGHVSMQVPVGEYNMVAVASKNADVKMLDSEGTLPKCLSCKCKKAGFMVKPAFLGHYAHAHSLVITYNYVLCPLYGANHLSYHDFLTAFHIYTLRQCLHILAYVLPSKV